jgi:hypothetical protein
VVLLLLLLLLLLSLSLPILDELDAEYNAAASYTRDSR